MPRPLVQLNIYCELLNVVAENAGAVPGAKEYETFGCTYVKLGGEEQGQAAAAQEEILAAVL